LIGVFKPFGAEESVLFYYGNKRARVDHKTGKFVAEEGFNPRNYFEYCNENTVSLSFDGSPLYDILNGYSSSNEIIPTHICCFQLQFCKHADTLEEA
jgi:hypothetical protein